MGLIMTIATEKTVYILDGKEFKYNHLEKYLTDKLGNHIDKMTDTHKLPPKVALYKLDYIIKNTDEIISILSASVVSTTNSFGEDTYINILSNEVSNTVWEKVHID